MTRPGVPLVRACDPRIQFPRTDHPLACRDNPRWFFHEQTSDAEQRRDTARAKLACRACPIIDGCLKWALANPEATRLGVWAATTPRVRATLRQRLKDRLGDDWVAVVAARDGARAQRRQRARVNPPTVAERVQARPAPQLPRHPTLSRACYEPSHRSQAVDTAPAPAPRHTSEGAAA